MLCYVTIIWYNRCLCDVKTNTPTQTLQQLKRQEELKMNPTGVSYCPCAVKTEENKKRGGFGDDQRVYNVDDDSPTTSGGPALAKRPLPQEWASCQPPTHSTSPKTWRFSLRLQFQSRSRRGHSLTRSLLAWGIHLPAGDV